MNRRRLVSFSATVLLLGAMLYLFASRERTPYDAPAEVVAPPEADAGPTDAGAESRVATASDASAGADAAAAIAAPAVKPLLDRPLRVSPLGWELFAPGVMGTDGNESSLYGDGLTVEVTFADAAATALGKLARGGADAQGADVAILPLPVLVASYDKLRALDPRVILIVGWSRGQEELRASSKPAPGDARVWVSGGDSARFAAGFFLDATGREVTKVKFLDDGDGKGATFFALAKGVAAPEESKVVFSTLDASRLVPFVAVAARGTVEGQREALTRWARGWLDGVARLQADAAQAAQRVQKARPGVAPEAVQLVERFGRMEHASLADNEAWLSQRRPVGLDALAALDFRVTRDSGAAGLAAPERGIGSADIVAGLSSDAGAMSGAAAPPAITDAKGEVVVATKFDAKGDATDVTDRVALYLAVFPRATVRVSMKSGEKPAQDFVGGLRDKVGSAGPRLLAGKDAKGAGALVEVLLVR